MLNKELLMTQAELPPVYVTLEFFGGRNSGTDYTWTSPDGTLKNGGAFDKSGTVEYLGFKFDKSDGEALINIMEKYKDD